MEDFKIYPNILTTAEYLQMEKDPDTLYRVYEPRDLEECVDRLTDLCLSPALDDPKSEHTSGMREMADKVLEIIKEYR